MRRQGIVKTIGAAASLVLVVVAWIVFAPTGLGGSVDYTIPTGTSMAPGIESGDLAVVRRSASYAVGDVVAYRSASLDRTVLHRIVDIDDDRYVTQGDANDWLDTDRPTAEEIHGRLWVRLPAIGGLLVQLRSPAGLVALAVAFGAIVAAGRLRPDRSGRHRRTSGASIPFRDLLVPHRTRVLPWLAVIAVLAAGVAAVSFSRSTTTETARDVTYRQQGTFSYRATAPTGPVYQDPDLTTGDTVFLQLVDEVEVSFDYRFVTGADHEVQGSGSLVAELGDAEGWRRTVRLSGNETVVDGRLELASTLDLAALRTTIESAEALTGVSRSSYTINVVADVRVDGTVSGLPFSEQLASPMTFQLDDLRLRLLSAGAQLEPRQAGNVVVADRERATIGVLGQAISVASARGVSMVVLLAALVALALVGVATRRHDLDAAATIVARHRDLFVPVTSLTEPADAVVVDDLDVLVRLAEQYERLVLHAPAGAGHLYLLDDRGTAYVHRHGDDRREPPGPTPNAGTGCTTLLPTADRVAMAPSGVHLLVPNGHATGNGHANGRADGNGRRPPGED
jgi:signal peptidase I